MIEITKEEADGIRLAQEKMNSAQFALRISSEDFSGMDKEIYYRAAIESYGMYRWLYQDLWNDILFKYHLDKKNYLLEGNIVYEQ